MNVTCQGCGTTYRVDPAKVPSAGVRARCATCDQVFWVRCEVAATAAPVVAAPTPSRAPAAPAPVMVPAATTAPAPTLAQATVIAPGLTTAPAEAIAPTPAPVVPEPAAPKPAAPAAPLASEADDFRPLQTPAVAAAPDVTPVPAVETPPSPVAVPGVANPVMPAYSRPAFGGAALRTNAPQPSAAQDLVPAEVADATRVAPPPPAIPASLPVLPEAMPVRPATLPPSAPPVRAGAATSALGGILPADSFEVPPVRPPAPTAAPVRPAGTRPLNPFLQQDPAARVRRLARALVSDMVTYHPGKKADGLRDDSLKQLFEEEIRKSWEEYADQVGRDVAESTPHFRDALNEILADGRLIF